MCCQRQAMESSPYRGALVLGVHSRARLTRSPFSFLHLPASPALSQACELLKGREPCSPVNLAGQPSSGATTQQTWANI